jgi:hypothetical protein
MFLNNPQVVLAVAVTLVIVNLLDTFTIKYTNKMDFRLN